MRYLTLTVVLLLGLFQFSLDTHAAENITATVASERPDLNHAKMVQKFNQLFKKRGDGRIVPKDSSPMASGIRIKFEPHTKDSDATFVQYIPIQESMLGFIELTPFQQQLRMEEACASSMEEAAARDHRKFTQRPAPEPCPSDTDADAVVYFLWCLYWLLIVCSSALFVKVRLQHTTLTALSQTAARLLLTSDESNDCTETLKEEIDDLKKANAILRDEVVKYYTQNTALEEESAKVQADMNKTLVLYQWMEQQLAEAQATVASLEVEKQDLEDQMQEAEEEKQEFIVELEKQEFEREELLVERQELEDEIAALQTTPPTTPHLDQETISQLEGQLENLQAKYDASVNDLHRVQTDHDASVSALRMLQKENDASVEETHMLQTNKDASVNALHMLQTKHDSSVGDLHTLQTDKEVAELARQQAALLSEE